MYRSRFIWIRDDKYIGISCTCMVLNNNITLVFFHRWSIGSTFNLWNNSLDLMLLSHCKTILNALFWSTRILLRTEFVALLQTGEQYSRWDWMIVKYNNLATFSLINGLALRRRKIFLSILRRTCSICVPHVKFGSRITPRYLHRYTSFRYDRSNEI